MVVRLFLDSCQDGIGDQLPRCHFHVISSAMAQKTCQVTPVMLICSGCYMRKNKKLLA